MTKLALCAQNGPVLPLESLRQLAKPVAKRMLYSVVRPGPVGRPLYSALYQATTFSREFLEWAERSLLATPTLLAKAAVYGDNITCDRLPYFVGDVRLELGSNIRFSGKCDIISPRGGNATLKIGNGVFIGHGCGFTVARSIEIGDYVALGAGCSLADTEGHSNYNPGRPIWEVPASEEDIAPVVIEDNVQFGKRVTVLKGVRIGARSVIGAGAVVRTNIPPDSVVMGNPGRVVTRLKPATQDAPTAQRESASS